MPNNNLHRYVFRFGRLAVALESPRPLAVSDRMALFSVPDAPEEDTVIIRCEIAEYPLPGDAALLRREPGGVRYVTDGKTEYMVYQRKTTPKPQMVLPMTGGRMRTLYLSPDLDDSYFSAHILLEHAELIDLLQKQDTWILHCCYVKTPRGAILFTANSGVGKSTQGSLWEGAGRGEVINGDRAAVFFQNGQLCAGGFVHSGSSGICKNETTTVRAIVLLHQSGENRVTALKTAQAVKGLYMQLVSCPYRKDQSERKLNFALSLCEAVPVLRLDCRPDVDAVQTLNKYLSKR